MDSVFNFFFFNLNPFLRFYLTVFMNLCDKLPGTKRPRARRISDRRLRLHGLQHLVRMIGRLGHLAPVFFYLPIRSEPNRGPDHAHNDLAVHFVFQRSRQYKMRPGAKDSAAKTLDFQVCHNYLVTLFMVNCKCLFQVL